MYMCSIHDKQRFCLRLLLTQVRGATSYENVRTVNDHEYDTYEEAARQLGLLDEEDNEFDKCLEEAATFKLPSQLRRLFASILLFCDLLKVDAYQLLRKHFNSMSEDHICDQERFLNRPLSLDQDFVIPVNKTLMDIEKYLIPYGKTLNDFDIVRPDYALLNIEQSNLLLEELNYDPTEIIDLLSKEDQLNDGQMNIYNTVI